MSRLAYVAAMLAAFLAMPGCDRKDSCLDHGGCWDSVDGVCRLDEPNANELCHRRVR